MDSFYSGNISEMMDTEMTVKTAVEFINYDSIKLYIIDSGESLKYLQRRVEEEKLIFVLLAEELWIAIVLRKLGDCWQSSESDFKLVCMLES